MACTFKEIQQRLDEKFPDSGFKLLDFRGMIYPMQFECPKHGIQRISRADNALRSPTCCPMCGRDNSTKGTKVAKAYRLQVSSYLSQLRTLIYEDAAPEDFKSLAMSYASKI